MIDKSQLRTLVKEVLTFLNLHSQAAEDLVLGTIAQESRMGTYLKQLGNGPALGVCQMEPATHNDIWDNYLKYKQPLANLMWTLSLDNGMFTSNKIPDCAQLVGNLYYAIAMCRILYLRKPDPRPQAGDIAGYAAYWKKHYNTPLGKGTTAEFLTNYSKYVA